MHPRKRPFDQDEETSKRLAIEAFVAAFGPRSVPKNATQTPEQVTSAVEAETKPESSADIVPLPRASGEITVRRILSPPYIWPKSLLYMMFNK
jgi:hypothetical protein